MLLSAGSFLPLIGQMLAKLPLTVLRYPSRVIPLGTLAIVALAVIGFDRIVRPRWLVFVAVALIVADLVPRVAPLLHSEPFNVQSVPYSPNVGRDGKILRVSQPQRTFDRRAWISGYLNLLERRFDAWTAAPAVSRSYLKMYETALRRRDVLDAMSIAYVLSPSGRGVVVRRNTTALPLAFFRDSGGRIIRPSSLAFTTNAVFVVIDAPSDGVVVVTQQEAPGWSVEIDGKAAAPQREGVFRAVRVNRGHHQIVWRDRPRAFMIGSALTILAIARMLLSKNFVKRKWHKKFFSRDSKFS